MSEYVLEVRNITKRFPGVLANDSIDLKIEKGKILAILGENGAGKSTLMNIIYGLYDPDEGQIFLNGEEVSIENPHDAIARGIGMVHQHFMLVPVFTALENIVLGSETTRGPTLDLNSARKEVLKISEQYGLPIDPDMLIEDMPVGLQQRVEIIKALYRQADILVLDEPTAVLTPQEADDLFEVMRSLVEIGKSIIFITHKLREVLDVSDSITVIRNGKVVGSTVPAEANTATLAAMMVGREVVLQVEKSEAEAGEVVLEVEDLIVNDERHQVAVDGISFSVRSGEILGIAGVQGNGQTELVEALTGLREIDSGQFSISGQYATVASPRKITEMGCAHIPEDRQRDGLVLGYSIADNLVLNTYYLNPFAKGMVIQQEPILAQAEKLVQNFDIRTPDAVTLAGSLSGGNQQKVIVAREFSRPVKFLLAAQPTRGLDVGSIEYIHKRLIQKRDEGTAVLLVSTELDEVMQLSDRIAVMYSGKIVDILEADKVTKEIVGLLMAGEKPYDSWKPQAVNAEGN
jgi:simple sugar transport system ATP-binding protein